MRVQGAGAEGRAWPFSLPLSPAVDVSGYFRETIRRDIRQARERFSGQQLRQELARLQRRLDSVELLSPDIIINLLLSYRDVQVCGAQRGGQWGQRHSVSDKPESSSWTHLLTGGFEQII